MAHHIGIGALLASAWAFLDHWSGAFQALAAIVAVIAYGYKWYQDRKKKS